jgi:hypothetical protein
VVSIGIGFNVTESTPGSNGAVFLPGNSATFTDVVSFFQIYLLLDKQL